MMVDIVYDPTWLAKTALLADADGREQAVTFAKATFFIQPNGDCVPVEASERQKLLCADEHYGDPGATSIRLPGDFTLAKPATDVLIVGSAYAPHGEPLPELDVTVDIAGCRKTIRVFGDRIWERTLLSGLRPSRPIPFACMPLRYERAFGGTTKNGTFMQNPLGTGFYALDPRAAVNAPLPNLERPEALIRDLRDQPLPIGLGVLGRNFQPRAAFAGTYNQAWREQRFPFLPSDFDPRYYQSAPLDQQFVRQRGHESQVAGLRGGERIQLAGLTPNGFLTFTLPKVSVPMQHRYVDRILDVESCLDTVILEPDRQRCTMVYSGVAPLMNKPTLLREIWIGALSRGRQRAIDTGKRYLSRGSQ